MAPHNISHSFNLMPIIKIVYTALANTSSAADNDCIPSDSQHFLALLIAFNHYLDHILPLPSHSHYSLNNCPCQRTYPIMDLDYLISTVSYIFYPESFLGPKRHQASILCIFINLLLNLSLFGFLSYYLFYNSSCIHSITQCLQSLKLHQNFYVILLIVYFFEQVGCRCTTQVEDQAIYHYKIYDNSKTRTILM